MAFLDRANIGNAKTAGMNDALGLSDADYQVSTAIAECNYR